MQSTGSPMWDYHLATALNPLQPADAPPVGVSDPASVPLPHPEVPATMQSLIDARLSCRRFSSEPLSLSSLATALHVGYGSLGEVTMGDDTYAHRPVPSAGAIYPMQLFVIARSVEGVAPGTYRWDADDELLVQVGPRPDDEAVAHMFLGQPHVGTAPAIIMIAGTLGATAAKYADRGYRYVLFEAGHVAQNICLASNDMGLASVPLGGFLDIEVVALLGQDWLNTPPLYAVAIGSPATADPSLARMLDLPA